MERPGFRPNKHLGRYGWVKNNIHLLNYAQWEGCIRHSYATMVANLLLNYRDPPSDVV